jgi:hypothetical protein
VVQLSPKDSSILTRITRYQRIPKFEREHLLDEASPKAKEIGKIILGTSTGANADAEMKEAAEAYRNSFQRRTGRKKSKTAKRA